MGNTVSILDVVIGSPRRGEHAEHIISDNKVVHKPAETNCINNDINAKL